MTKPCIVVAGQGRCGSSLIMQMLDAAGVPCVGDWPAFETDATVIGKFDANAFAALCETAIKLLDPAAVGRFAMPHHIVIWLDRDPREQAASALKMLSSFGHSVPTDRRARRGMESSFRTSREGHRAALKGPPMLTLTFETLIEQTVGVVAGLRAFLSFNGWADLAFDRMVGVRIPRHPSCYPGMLEFRQMAMMA